MEERRVEISLEGGIHSPLQFYNLECFIPFQLAGDPVKASNGEEEY